VDERRHAALTLSAGHSVQRDRGLAARFRPEDFDDAPARQAAPAQRQVQADRAAGDALHVERRGVAQLHDGALAELLFDLLQRVLQLPVVRHGWNLLRGKDKLFWAYDLRLAIKPPLFTVRLNISSAHPQGKRKNRKKQTSRHVPN